MKIGSGVFLITTILLLSGCGSSDLAGGPGTGSETTNSMTVAAYYPDGTAAANAVVRIRNRNYLAGLPDNLSNFSKDTLTDSNGLVTVFLDPGEYTIETNDMRGHAAQSSNSVSLNDSIYIMPVLESTGSITGSLDSLQDAFDVRVGVYGLERTAVVDTVNGSFVLGDMPAGIYTIKVTSIQNHSILPEISGVLVTSGTHHDIGTLSSTGRSAQMIHLNTTFGGAGVPETVYDFPVMIRLDDSNFDFDSFRSFESSLIFRKGAHELPHEIEFWDTQKKEAVVWVKVDTLRGDGITTVLMEWGNASGNDFSNGSVVFDTSLGFRGVWHMAQGSDGMAHDATQNGNHAINNGALGVPGIIGEGGAFDGETAFYEVSDGASAGLDFGVEDTFTLSAWIYADELDSEYQDIITKGNHQYGMQINKLNAWTLFKFRHRSGWDTTCYVAAERVWTHVAGVFAGGDQYLYINGKPVADTFGTIASTDDRDQSFNLLFGRRSDLPERYFKGILDEIRIVGRRRSTWWIKLCFENQRQDQTLVNIYR